MKAKELKEIVSKIPDNDEVTFEYSISFTFSKINKVYHHKEIDKYFKEETGEIDESVPSGKHDWLISFDN